jgi:hypothetical protein
MSSRLIKGLDHDSLSVIASKLKTSTDKYNLAKHLNDREMRKEIIFNHRIIVEHNTRHNEERDAWFDVGDSFNYNTKEICGAGYMRFVYSRQQKLNKKWNDKKQKYGYEQDDENDVDYMKVYREELEWRENEKEKNESENEGRNEGRNESENESEDGSENEDENENEYESENESENDNEEGSENEDGSENEKENDDKNPKRNEKFYIKENGLYFVDKLIYSYVNGKNNRYYWFEKNEDYDPHLVIFEPNKIIIFKISKDNSYVVQDYKKLDHFIKKVNFNSFLITLENGDNLAICLDLENNIVIGDCIYKKIKRSKPQSDNSEQTYKKSNYMFVKNDEILRLFYGSSDQISTTDYFQYRAKRICSYQLIEEIYDKTDKNLDILFKLCRILVWSFSPNVDEDDEGYRDEKDREYLIFAGLSYRDFKKYNKLLTQYVLKKRE